MNTPTRATPENWELIKDRADRHGSASDRALCDIADILAALERRVEALEGPAAKAAELRAALQQENQRQMALEGCKDTSATSAPSLPAGALVDQIDTDLREAFRKSVRSGVIDPLPEQRQDFLSLVLAIMQSETAEQAANAAVATVADWLERKHSARIANGSGFADLLREMLDREAGR
jgi:hypothetical protein